MTRITVDDETARKLVESGSTIEVCDERGRVLGRFVTMTARNDATPEAPGTREERRRRGFEDERFTTDEVLERLGLRGVS